MCYSLCNVLVLCVILKQTWIHTLFMMIVQGCHVDHGIQPKEPLHCMKGRCFDNRDLRTKGSSKSARSNKSSREMLHDGFEPLMMSLSAEKLLPYIQCLRKPPSGARLFEIKSSLAQLRPPRPVNGLSARYSRTDEPRNMGAEPLVPSVEPSNLW